MIEFGVDGAAPLPKKDGRLLLSIDRKGRLITSSQEETGFTRDEYYLVGENRIKVYVQPNSSNRLIWGPAIGGLKSPGHRERTYEVIFVGSESDKARFPASPPIPE